MAPAPVDLTSVNKIVKIDLEDLAIGTAIQLVQGQSATLFEQQLKDQMKEIQERNRKIGDLNTALSSARELLAAFGEKDGADKKISDVINDQRNDIKDSSEWKAENDKYREKQEASKESRSKYLNGRINVAKKLVSELHQKILDGNGGNYIDIGHITHKFLTNPSSLSTTEMQYFNANQDLKSAESEKQAVSNIEIKDLEIKTKAGDMLEKLKTSADAAGLQVDVAKKGDLQTLVENIKTLIDSLSNDQQQAMVRLQNYTNKYNETVEIRTNAIKRDHEMAMRTINNMTS